MATSRLGVVATLSTLGVLADFLLARLSGSTIDSLTGGRFGWNIVTSAEDLAAQNFGIDKLPPREKRYEMADEYLEVVNKLFASWDSDAVVLDREAGIYADRHEGSADRPCCKVLQGARSSSIRSRHATIPTGVFVQAGGSPRGRDFAALHADSIISVASSGPEA